MNKTRFERYPDATTMTFEGHFSKMLGGLFHWEINSLAVVICPFAQIIEQTPAVIETVKNQLPVGFPLKSASPFSTDWRAAKRLA